MGNFFDQCVNKCNPLINTTHPPTVHVQAEQLHHRHAGPRAAGVAAPAARPAAHVPAPAHAGAGAAVRRQPQALRAQAGRDARLWRSRPAAAGLPEARRRPEGRGRPAAAAQEEVQEEAAESAVVQEEEEEAGDGRWRREQGENACAEELSRGGDEYVAGFPRKTNTNI